jgi:hypothetical protein
MLYYQNADICGSCANEIHNVACFLVPSQHIGNMGTHVKSYGLKDLSEIDVLFLEPCCRHQTLQCTIPLEKLIVTQQVKKVTVICDIRRFISVFTTAHHWNLS